jgi:hypothetical protein
MLSDDDALEIGQEDPLARWAASHDEERAPAEEVRAENAASAGPSWAPTELMWRTRRWWPSLDGWALFLIPGIAWLPALWMGSDRSANGLGLGPVVALGFFIASVLIAIILIETLPWAHEQTTAKWTVRFAADTATLERQTAETSVKSATVSRAEAGRLDITLTEILNRGRRTGKFQIDQVTGFSLDEKSSITLIRRSAHFGPLHARRVQPGRLLIEWWPVNARSKAALDDFKAHKVA